MDLRNLFKSSDNALEFQAGATIFAEGYAADVMYVVLEGEVEVRVGNKLVEAVGPGDIIGEMALIDMKPRSATAVTKTQCRVAPVDEKRFQFMVQQTPYFSLHVMRVMADRLRRMNANLST
jgi:CRP-like cAMP-binding protein